MTFSNIPYSEALNVGKRQDAIMKEIMKMPNINDIWDSLEVENAILKAIKS